MSPEKRAIYDDPSSVAADGDLTGPTRSMWR